MSRLIPTLGARDTSKNIKDFLKTNRSILWGLVKSLAPWIAGLTLFDIIVTHMFFPDSKNGFMLGQLISGYFYTALVISWHRVAIHGPENFTPMDPFKPQKHELVFIGMGMLLFVSAIAAGALAGATVFIHPVIAIVSVAIIMIAAMYLGYKICFYFPAKAVNNSITFKESYSLTKGYFWKLMAAYFLASFKYIIGMILYMILMTVFFILVATITGEALENSALESILAFMFTLPILLYFYPLFYAVGVTALSNYYQHAIQNKK